MPQESPRPPVLLQAPTKLVSPLPNNPARLDNWKIRSCERIGCQTIMWGSPRKIATQRFCGHACARIKPEAELTPVGKRVRQWRSENPQRAANAKAIQRAKYRGVVSNPTSCADCGATDGHIVFAHSRSEDPLQALPLCRSCLKA